MCYSRSFTTTYFSWQYEGKRHILALYYNTKQQSWKPVANTEWLKQVVLPLIQPLFEQQPVKATLPMPGVSADPVQEAALQAYFADALTCLTLLESFANDNIDFSIICQRTRGSVRMILNDPMFTHLNRAALSAALDTPDTADFYQAKEYLSRCLTLCNINSVAS